MRGGERDGERGAGTGNSCNSCHAGIGEEKPEIRIRGRGLYSGTSTVWFVLGLVFGVVVTNVAPLTFFFDWVDGLG